MSLKGKAALDMKMAMTETRLALDGVKVVEFAVFAAGPMVGKHLGEQGATVIHVESRRTNTTSQGSIAQARLRFSTIRNMASR